MLLIILQYYLHWGWGKSTVDHGVEIMGKSFVPTVGWKKIENQSNINRHEQHLLDLTGASGQPIGNLTVAEKSSEHVS